MKVTLKNPSAVKAAVAVSVKQPEPAPVKSKTFTTVGTAKVGNSHNQDAEMAVLGACLIESSAIRAARQVLKPEMFYYDVHRVMFKLASDLMDVGSVVDVVTLGEAIRASKGNENFDKGHLIECVHKVETAAHIEHYAKIVASLYYEREIVQTCKGASVALEKQQESVLVEKIRDLVLLKESVKNPFMLQYNKDGLVGFIDEMMEQKNHAMFMTGIKEVDHYWNGMKPGEINTWGAATNEGKSIMLLNLMHLSGKMKRKCLYVGTEMTAAETVQRHLSMSSGLDAWKIRKPQLTKEELIKLESTISNELYQMHISILDDPEPDLARIEAAISASKAEIVFLDYLERFEMPRAESLRLQIKEFMRSVKTMARRNGVIIHLAAQLNRSTYGDVEKPPTLADLSESSAIEKESDRVMLFWSPKKKQLMDPAGNGRRVIEVLQMKNRHGPKGMSYDFVLDEVNLRMVTKSQHGNPFNHKL